MRILLVSQMYPGDEEPDYGVFVRQVEVALAERGHELERAVLTRRGGGKRKYVELARRVRVAATRFRPDVVYAHFLFPTGAIALLGRAPLVVTAHGQDVANVGRIPGVRAATRRVIGRAAAVVAVSDYLRRELERNVPEARAKTEVVDCGVDLERFRPADGASARAALDWGERDGPYFLCVGSLTERKNVVRLASAFRRYGRGSLVFAGDGPLRPQLEQIEGVRLAGRLSHDEIPRWLAACDVVCQPSLVEPFGQALLEAMACERSVVATRVGGPPEFVTPEAGVLVDPLDAAAIAEALDRAVALPSPNQAAREAARPHDVKLQAARIEAILERAARDRRA